MLSNAEYKLKDCPFSIVRGQIINSTEQKHVTFNKTDDAVLKGKTLFLVIRKLPDWWKSYLWHQSKHTYVNVSGNLAKDSSLSYIGENPKKRPGFLFLPKIHAHNTFPDIVLKEHIYPNVKFIRMEYLIQDFSQYGINLKQIDKKKYSYSPPEKYWNEESTSILYEHNPNWAAIDREFYPECRSILDRNFPQI